MDYNEFAEKIKTKYPQYKDMDNKDLAQRMVAKYPNTYDVSFDEVQEPIKASATKIDIRPSRAIKAVPKAIGAVTIGRKKNIPYKEAYKLADEAYNQLEQEHPILVGGVPKAVDFGAALALPMTKVKALGSLGNMALSGLYQGGVIGGFNSLAERGDLSGAGQGAALGAGLGGAIGAVPYVGRAAQPVGRGAKKAVSALTSVPEKYLETALAKEKAGESILKGTFNPDTAYQNVGAKIQKAKEMLPDSTSYGEEFSKIGEKALQGIQGLKTNAEARITEALEKLNNRELQNGNIKNAINSVINSFGEGGVYNPAIEKSPKVMALLENLNKEGLTLRDLHRIKNELYDIGYQSAGLKEGTQADVARATAEQINNYLRGLTPEYAKANDVYSAIVNLERTLPKDTTIAGNLSRYGSKINAMNGMDTKLKQVNDLLPTEQQFIPETKKLIEAQAETDKLKNLIGENYARTPRSLEKIHDLDRLQALEDLQNKSGINFMDEFNNVRAREALENWFPGQGGGSGSKEGFGNLLRTAIIGGSPTAAFLGHPQALFGLGLVSPKITGQAYVKGANVLNKIKNSQALNKLGQRIGRYITPAAVEMMPLQGYASYEDYGQ